MRRHDTIKPLAINAPGRKALAPNNKRAALDASTPTPDRETQPPTIWVMTALALWALIAVLRIQVARIVPFDAIVGAVLGTMLLFRFLPGVTKRRGGPRWKLNAPRLWYVAMGGLMCAGMISGLHASDFKLWIIELVTLLYLGLMLIALDFFSTGRVETMLRLGGWAFAGVCALCGSVAALHLFFGVQITFFFEVAYLSSKLTDKFTGLMRFANQWSGYFVAMFPLLLAISFEEKRSLPRAVLIGCIILGALTVPASGSRSGIFLMVAQAAGFITMLSLLNRNGQAFKRLTYIAFFVSVLGLTASMALEATSDNPIITRSLGAFDLVFEQQSVSDEWRDYNWRAAMTEFGKHPIIGIGLGTFELLYDRHEVHSSYLSFAAETGLLGVSIYIFLLTLPLLMILRALGLSIVHGRVDPMLIALLMAVSTQLLFAVHHNNTRHRHVWTILMMGMLYAQVVTARIRAETMMRQRANLQNRTRLRRPPQRHPRKTDAVA